jgi:hypothetical protein
LNTELGRTTSARTTGNLQQGEKEAFLRERCLNAHAGTLQRGQNVQLLTLNMIFPFWIFAHTAFAM